MVTHLFTIYKVNFTHTTGSEVGICYAQIDIWPSIPNSYSRCLYISEIVHMVNLWEHLSTRLQCDWLCFPCITYVLPVGMAYTCKKSWIWQMPSLFFCKTASVPTLIICFLARKDIIVGTSNMAHLPVVLELAFVASWTPVFSWHYNISFAPLSWRCLDLQSKEWE